jgi:hypothetical protein
MTTFNTLLREKTRADIDAQVDKILRDLGRPEPPIRLPEVRSLLKLHLEYYSSSNTGMLGEIAHMIVMAGQQIWNRKGLLGEAIRKCDLSALYLFDRKRILISSDLAKLKQRWGEAHEIGHSIIPWHEQFCHGDQEATLSIDCHAKIEAEANYAAGQVLFLRDRFRDELLSCPLSIEELTRLAGRYGNTITSALWRAVETLHIPAFGLVGAHPVEHPIGEGVRRFIRSNRFAVEFPAITPEAIFPLLAQFCKRGRGNLGSCEMLLTDAAGQKHIFYVECFYNSYDALTLGVWSKRHATMAAV